MQTKKKSPIFIRPNGKPSYPAEPLRKGVEFKHITRCEVFASTATQCTLFIQ
jgi:hypothetical protein